MSFTTSRRWLTLIVMSMLLLTISLSLALFSQVAYASPTVNQTAASSSGNLFFVSWHNGLAYRVHSDGSIGWQRSGYTEYADKAPAYANGILYIASDNGSVYALRGSDGYQLWSFNTGAKIESSVTVSGNTAYVGSDNGNLYALNAFTGAYEWTFYTQGQIHSTPLVVNGVVYFGSGYGDGEVFAVQTNGSSLWAFNTGSGVYGSAAFSNGVVYIGAQNGVLYGINASTGQLRYTFSAGSAIYSPTVSGNTVYVSSGNTLYALTLNETVLWSQQLDSGYAAQPLIDYGNVYTGSSNGHVYAYTQDGRWLWTSGYLEIMGNQLVAANGQLYTGGLSHPYALDPSSGQVTNAFNSVQIYDGVTAPAVGS